MPAPVGTVSGTWGRGETGPGSYRWWKPPSVFIANLRNAGLEIVSETDYFDWSTNLDGVRGHNDDWLTSGKALYWWWAAHGMRPLSLIGHSHAGQIIAYALAYSRQLYNLLKIDPVPMVLDHLVTVGSPVREDMQPVWDQAKPLIEDWTHIYCDEKIILPDDLGYQELGSSNSPEFPFTRLMPQADRNVEVTPATTHHDLIQSKLWNDHDFWQYLK